MSTRNINIIEKFRSNPVFWSSFSLSFIELFAKFMRLFEFFCDFFVAVGVHRRLLECDTFVEASLLLLYLLLLTSNAVRKMREREKSRELWNMYTF